MDEIFERAQPRLAYFPGKRIFVRKRSAEAASAVPDESLDFVYVDGNHCYDGVHADLLSSLGKLKTGGFLIFDDWSWHNDEGKASVKQAACDLTAANPG